MKFLLRSGIVMLFVLSFLSVWIGFSGIAQAKNMDLPSVSNGGVVTVGTRYDILYGSELIGSCIVEWHFDWSQLKVDPFRHDPNVMANNGWTLIDYQQGNVDFVRLQKGQRTVIIEFHYLNSNADRIYVYDP